MSINHAFQKAAENLTRQWFASEERQPTPIDGWTKVRVKAYVNRLLKPFTKGFFHDNGWAPVAGIHKALENAGLDWTITGGDYHGYETGMPSKRWLLRVDFINQNGRLDFVSGPIVASGGGGNSTAEDPFSSYDITAYVG